MPKRIRTSSNNVLNFNKYVKYHQKDFISIECLFEYLKYM